MCAQKKVILISGCSSGIGLYCAQQLARTNRWRVLASARKKKDVNRLKNDGFETLTLDLSSSASIQEAMQQLSSMTNHRLDALFNNGAYGQPGAVEDLPRQALQEQFETNVFGTQELTNLAIAIMRRQGHGRIVQNSSILGFVPLAYRGAYNASKYALEGLTDTMRLELFGTNIHLSLIEPGPISSDFRKNANRQFLKFFDDNAIATSAHHVYYHSNLVNEKNAKSSSFILGPDAVYQSLLHALQSPKPRCRYRVTTPTKILWLLKRLLPTSCLDAFLRRVS